MEGERGVVLEIYKKFLITLFVKEEYIYPVKLDELDRTDWQRSRMSAKWLKDKTSDYHPSIVKARKEIDEEVES